MANALIEYRAMAKLRPSARNSRTHTDDQVRKVAASMREWGWTMPALVGEDDEIIAGHCRVRAADVIYASGGALKMASGAPIPKGKVPVIVARGWSEAQRRAYIIADNQLGLDAGWDESMLRIELGELKDVGFDLSLIGFNADELHEYTSAPLLADPEIVPDVEAEAVSRPGDIWVCGSHRIMCGDATSRDDVAAVLAGSKPHLMVTDPPYGVEYDPVWRDGVDLNLGKKLGRAGSGRSLGVVENDNRIDWRDAWALFPGDVAYVWHASYFISTTQASLEASGFVMRAHIIWAKQIQVFGRGDYHWKHEPCWYAVRKGRTGHWAGDRKQTTVWDIQNNNPLGGGHELKTGHSTQKPIECMKRPIENNSKVGDAVYDPFSGSGTTMIACEMTGRRCLALEINPPYVDVAVRRWQGVTGQAATLEASGLSFVEVTASRQSEAAA